MLKAAFLHDTNIDFTGGAELSNHAVLAVAEQHGVQVVYDNLSSFRTTKQLISKVDFIIVNSTIRCNYEFLLIDYLVDSGKPYIKWEHDYNFCNRRDALCFVDMNVKGCCKADRVNEHRKLFRNASLSVFVSPKHFQLHKEMYGEAIGNYFVVPPLVDISTIKSAPKKKNSVCFASDLTFKKGGHELVDFAIANPQMHVEVFGENQLEREMPSNISLKGKQENNKVLEALSTAEYFFFKPKWIEPGGRIAAEAFLSGCKTITNDRVGFHSQPYYPAYPDVARKEISNAPHLFWEKAKQVVSAKVNEGVRWKNVLIYKSFGGLGDFLLAIPSIHKIAAVSNRVSVCVPPSLEAFLKNQLKEYQILPEDFIHEANLSEYDKVIDLKNYPSFKKDEGNLHQMNFPSYRRLNQHALRHYLDAVATLHPGIDNSYEGYPYFKRKRTSGRKYFTVHAGAGFAAKHYPAKNFGILINLLLHLFEDLDCQIISGPDDPRVEDLFDEIPPRVFAPKGKLEDMAEIISGALFHIGNDSGVTHLAGAFNIPTVTIHGPTGPGTWASFAEQHEVIWGKQGVCHIACNYDVSISCEHRICLRSVSPQRVAKHVLKLLERISSEQNQARFIINPEAEVEKQEDAYILKMHDNELLLEFSDATESTLFNKLLDSRLLVDEVTPSFSLLLDVLVQHELIFKLPVGLGEILTDEIPSSEVDLTIVSHVMKRDSIGRHGIIFGDILKDSFSINGIATRQPSADDVEPALYNKLTKRGTAGKIALFTDVLWHNNLFKPYRHLPKKSEIKLCYSMFESSLIPAEWAAIIDLNFDGVLIPDKWLVDVYKSSGVSKPLKVLPLACYLQDFLKQPLKQKANHTFTFGISSAVWLRKNIVGVVEAFKLAFAAQQNVKLRIHSRYGLPPEVELIRKAIGNDNRIEFFIETLSTDDYLSFMKSLDAYVFLSMGEGFSVTPREAMALGLPVILSNNTGQQTICESSLAYSVPTQEEIPAFYEAFNQVNGSFYKPDIEVAAEFMREIFENRETVYEHAKLRRSWASQYDLKNLKTVYIETMKQILQNGFSEEL